MNTICQFNHKIYYFQFQRAITTKLGNPELRVFHSCNTKLYPPMSPKGDNNKSSKNTKHAELSCPPVREASLLDIGTYLISQQ